MGSHEVIFTKFAPGGVLGKLWMNLKSDLVKVNSKTPFCPPKCANWGQSGPNPIFCPIMAIFTGKGPFWKIWTVVKSDFGKFDFDCIIIIETKWSSHQQSSTWAELLWRPSASTIHGKFTSTQHMVRIRFNEQQIRKLLGRYPKRLGNWQRRSQAIQMPRSWTFHFRVNVYC